MDPTITTVQTVPEQEDYPDVEEAVDVLLAIQGVLEVLMSRPQPAYIADLLHAADRRARSVTDRALEWNWYH